MSGDLRTSAEVRRWFFDRGLTVSAWAHDHGFPRDLVYAVLAGRIRCSRGQSHEIAVALGLKAPPNDSIRDLRAGTNRQEAIHDLI